MILKKIYEIETNDDLTEEEKGFRTGATIGRSVGGCLVSYVGSIIESAFGPVGTFRESYRRACCRLYFCIRSRSYLLKIKESDYLMIFKKDN